MSKCVYCGSTGFGMGCGYGPNKIHMHNTDSRHCRFCGGTGYGYGCGYSPNKVHVHGTGDKCVYCGSTQTGWGCAYAPDKRTHDKVGLTAYTPVTAGRNNIRSHNNERLITNTHDVAIIDNEDTHKGSELFRDNQYHGYVSNTTWCKECIEILPQNEKVILEQLIAKVLAEVRNNQIDETLKKKATNHNPDDDSNRTELFHTTRYIILRISSILPSIDNAPMLKIIWPSESDHDHINDLNQYYTHVTPITSYPFLPCGYDNKYIAKYNICGKAAVILLAILSLILLFNYKIIWFIIGIVITIFIANKVTNKVYSMTQHLDNCNRGIIVVDNCYR